MNTLIDVNIVVARSNFKSNKIGNHTFAEYIAYGSKSECERIAALLNAKSIIWNGTSSTEYYVIQRALWDNPPEIWAQLNRRFIKKLLKFKGIGRKAVDRLWDENN